MAILSLRRTTRPPTDAAAARVAAIAPVPAVRRTRRPWLVAAGIALFVVASLGVATMIGAASDREQVLAVAQAVPVGQQITADDLTTVGLSPAAGLAPVPADQHDQIVGGYAAVALTPGSILVAEQVSDAQVPAAGQQLVPVALPPGRLPATGLTPGAQVLVVTTSSAGTDELPTDPDTIAGVVYRVGAGDSAQQQVVVDLIVSDKDGPRLAALAAAGRAALVVDPPAGD